MRLFHRFFKSILKEQKALLFTVFIGMGLCFLMVINFLYEMHLSAFKKEEIAQINNHVDIYYDDMSAIGNVIGYLDGNKNVQSTLIQTTVKVNGSSCILVAYEGPEKYLFDYAGEQENIISVGEGLTKGDIGAVNVGIDASGRTYGDSITILGKEYRIKGRLNIGISLEMPTIYLTKQDMQDILAQEKGKGHISFWYEEGISKSVLHKIEEKITKISTPSKISQAEKLDNFQTSTVLTELKDIFLTTVIAVINYMIIYGFMMNKRMKQYGILKLVGVSDGKLTVFMYLEMLIELAVACVFSIIVFLIYLEFSGKTNYGVPIICTYGIAFMLLLNVVIFMGISIRYRRMTPFQFYKVTE